MSWVAYDTETDLISPGRAAPPLACLSYVTEEGAEGLVNRHDALPLFERWLDEKRTFVGQNIAFDMGVMAAEYPHLLPRIFDSYDAGRVKDTKIRQQIVDIAMGCYRGFTKDNGEKVRYDYSLAALAKRFLGIVLDKDTYRMGYGALRDIPISLWPEGAQKYALDDARVTATLFRTQQQDEQWMPDEAHRMRSCWWQHLTATWGIRTRKDAVERLAADAHKRYEEIETALIAKGYVKAHKNPEKRSRNTKVAKARMVAVCEARSLAVPLTDSGQVCLDAEACEDSEDLDLKLYSELSTIKKTLSTDIPMLELGTLYPIHTRFNLAESGRSTSSSPNIQNVRTFMGIREAFAPREGYVYAQSDYASLELHTLAQVCYSILGGSTLGDTINAGMDCHTDFAGMILGIPYEEAARRRKLPKSDAVRKEIDGRRDMAKAANFGLPGGLGIDTFIIVAKAMFGVVLSYAEAEALKAAWLRKWPEMKAYFAWINAQFTKQNVGMGGKILMQHLFTNRYRGRCGFTQACNTLFQGLGSDVANSAGYLVSKACYVDENSPLFGSRIVNFIHDELILEVPDDQYAHERAQELGRLMRVGAEPFLPNCPAKCEPQLMRYWSKDAEPVYQDGRLVPWPVAA